MNQKITQGQQYSELHIQSLCKALEEGGTKVADNFIAFSKHPGKH